MVNPSRMKSGDDLGFRLPAKTHMNLTLAVMTSQIATHTSRASRVRVHDSRFGAAGSPPTQQSKVDHAHQFDIRPESVHPVILSSTAKIVVDSGCFDHCCPLDFATQSELKEDDFSTRQQRTQIKLKHYGTRVVEAWTREVNGAEIPLKIRFNMVDVKSPLLSTSNLRKQKWSVVLDQQQTIQEEGTTIVLTDHNGLPTLELRLAGRLGEVDDRMCAPVEEIGEEARRATPMYVPRGPLDAESTRKRKSSPQARGAQRRWYPICADGLRAQA